MMRNGIVLLLLSLLFVSTTHAATRVSLKEIEANGWDMYIGKQIQITTPLYVCGVYYDSLVLSPERLFVPEENAIGLNLGDSTKYYELKRKNELLSIRLSAKYSAYKIRTGSVLKNLKANVVGERKLLTGRTPKFVNNRPPRKFKINNADILVCASNVQNFFYHLGGYAGAKTEAQRELQIHKIAKGLCHIDADIYALCEVEKGNSAPEALVNEMNKMKKSAIYDYVSVGNMDGDTIACCYLYRKDKVKPYTDLRNVFNDPANFYHYRLIVQGFEHIKSGEQFIININHLRSKRGDAARADSIRANSVDSLLQTLEKLSHEVMFQDDDVLLVGDYNCYAQERPIHKLVSSGYKDMLLIHAPHDYSYIYKSEAGFLDRVFASPSMAEKITCIVPYHINADSFYSKWYKRGLDKTMYRFSDHDPILIGIKLQ